PPPTAHPASRPAADTATAPPPPGQPPPPAPAAPYSPLANRPGPTLKTILAALPRLCAPVIGAPVPRVAFAVDLKQVAVELSAGIDVQADDVPLADEMEWADIGSFNAWLNLSLLRRWLILPARG